MNCNQKRRCDMSNRKKSYEKPRLKGIDMLETAAAGACCKASGAACPKRGIRQTSGKQATKSVS